MSRQREEDREKAFYYVAPSTENIFSSFGQLCFHSAIIMSAHGIKTGAAFFHPNAIHKVFTNKKIDKCKQTAYSIYEISTRAIGVLTSGTGGEGVELSERKQAILAAIVELYIKTGEPVGSKGLLAHMGMSISSATVRNEMSDLVVQGFLEQPHTSAGRIPSAKGYRYYVDKLMRPQEVDESFRKLIEVGIAHGADDPARLLENAVAVLAELSHCAAVSTTPAGEKATIRRIELVPVGQKTLMLVLLTSNGVLKSRMCRLDCELTPSLLETFYNMAACTLVGYPIAEINAVMLQGLAASLGANALSMLPLLGVVSDLAQRAAQSQVMLEGQSNLLGHKEFDSSVYQLMEFLNKGEPLGQIINLSKGALDVRIGAENGYQQLEKSSLIFARYFIHGEQAGTIGLIGPTRIDYAKLIPGVQYLTKLVSEFMTQALED